MTSPANTLGPFYNYDLPYKLGLRLYPSVYGEQTDILTPSAGTFRETQGSDADVFNPSETARNFLNNYKELSGGLSLRVLPPDKTPEEVRSNDAAGFYYSADPKFGHSNPKERAVYLNPNSNNMYVLAHEAGHAADPELDPSTVARARGEGAHKTFIDFYHDPTVSPKAFLSAYLRGGLEASRGEARAQKYAAEFLEKSGVDPTKQIKDNWYKGYPASYVDDALDQAAELNVKRSLGLPMEHPVIPVRMQAPKNSSIFYSVYDPSSDFSRGMLNLGLDPEYRSSEEAIRTRARQYIDSKLQPIVDRYR